MQSGIWTLSSPTRDGTHPPALGAWNLSHWTAREAPWFIVLDSGSCSEFRHICIWLGCCSPLFWAQAPEVATKAFFQAHSQPLSLLTLSRLVAGPELKLVAASHTLEKCGFIPQGWTRKSMRPPFPATPWREMSGASGLSPGTPPPPSTTWCPFPSKETGHCPSLLGWPTVPICLVWGVS